METIIFAIVSFVLAFWIGYKIQKLLTKQKKFDVNKEYRVLCLRKLQLMQEWEPTSKKLNFSMDAYILKSMVDAFNIDCRHFEEKLVTFVGEKDVDFFLDQRFNEGKNQALYLEYFHGLTEIANGEDYGPPPPTYVKSSVDLIEYSQQIEVLAKSIIDIMETATFEPTDTAFLNPLLKELVKSRLLEIIRISFIPRSMIGKTFYEQENI